MALIVEDGTGRVDAESYTSVTEANAYHGARGNAGWTGSDPVKEAALRRAMTYIEGVYNGRWIGLRAARFGQSLSWPRVGAVDENGWPIAYNAVPANLKAAVAEAALSELASPGSLTPPPTTTQRVTSKKVGSIAVTYANSTAGGSGYGPTGARVLTNVEHLLSNLVRSASLSGRAARG